VNLALVRSFFAVVEHGSLNQAALRLGVSQSTLTRQMHALEAEVGGRLLERTATGVALTAGGRTFLDGARGPLAQFDAAMDETRRVVRGQRTMLRIGYLASAARTYLNPALATLRRDHPDVKVKLLDLSPGEQIAALRRGDLDVALLGHAGGLLTREFFVRRLATLPVLVALPDSHPLATHGSVALAELRGESFVGAPEADMPGYNDWITQLCRKARFRPRIAYSADSLAHMLSTAVAEGAIGLLPAYTTPADAPGVAFRPLRDAAAKVTFSVAWQRGTVPAAVRSFLNALPQR
jgi:DNA-binding transcriptional LysR family regulator